MINLFDRFIGRIFIVNFLGGLVVLCTLYFSIDAMSKMVREGGDPLAWLTYYMYSVPAIVYQLVPVACLVGTVFTLSALNKNSELTALFSLGMSLARISAPILIIVTIISVANFLIGDRLLPRTNQLKNFTYFVKIKNKPGLYSTVKTNKIWYRSQNVLFNIKTLDTAKGRAQGASFYYFDDAWNLVQLLSASEVKIVDKTWKLQNGTLTLFDAELGLPRTKAFSEKVISVDDNLADVESNSRASEVQSLSQLRRFIKKNKEAGLDTLHYEVDYHAKYSFAFAAFVMAFLGIPFCVSSVRSGGFALSVGSVILLAFGYWALFSSGQTLGRHGVVPPQISVWLPNVLSLGLSGWFLLRLKR